MNNLTTPAPDTNIEWQTVPGYDGRYEVSSTGLIRRAKGNRQYPAHSLLSTRTDGYGYTVVILMRGDRQRTRYLHRLIMLAFKGECPKGMEVNHINGIKTDNHLANLEYISHAHNIRHALNTLNAAFGQKGVSNKHAKLDDDKIREIRKIASVGISHTRIAELYGVTQSLISNILKGKYWSHVQD